MEEKIEIPKYLGLKVQKRLREKFGIETDGIKFSRQELNQIDELEIVPPMEGGLKGLELLTNIEKLVIISIGNTAFQTKKIPSIVDDDINSIAKCRNLKELSIINQTKINCLDCSNLNGLTKLEIKNNRCLKSIKGLENVKTLEKIICYGNEALHRIPNLDKVILNNSDLFQTELDFLLFPDAIGYNREDNTYNFEADQKLKNLEDITKAVYIESMMKKEVNIPHSKMMQVHQRSLEILKENHVEGDNIEMAEKIEEYLVQNIKYNMNLGENSSVENKAIVGARSSANGLYSAIMKAKGSCEGFTRAMQYLLKLKGINSRNVYCMPKPENEEVCKNLKEEYHSVIYLENLNMYSDLCYDAICLEQRR